jgi:p24 family protein delta-1
MSWYGVNGMNETFLGVPEHQAHTYHRSIDLDIDIGADAVDYNAIAKQEVCGFV